MRNKFLVRFFIAFILLLYSTFSYFINTDFDMSIFFICVLIYLFIFFDLIFQIYKSIKVKYTDKVRNYLCIFYALVLIIVFIKPKGIIDFEELGSKIILTGFYEGAASCTTTLKLKENNTYRLNSICFGSDTKIGKYVMRNDSIFFDKKDDIPYSFGVIDDNSLDLYYKEYSEKDDYFNLMIIRN